MLKQEEEFHLSLVGKFVLMLLVVGLMSSFPICSSAEDPPPNLKGTWKGSAQYVGHNKRAQHTDPLDAIKYRTVDFTVKIDVQKGCRFQGVKTSKRANEQFVGVINPNDNTICLAENDGYYFGKLVSPDKIELIYMEASPDSKVAALEVFERVK